MFSSVQFSCVAINGLLRTSLGNATKIYLNTQYSYSINVITSVKNHHARGMSPLLHWAKFGVAPRGADAEIQNSAS